MLDDIERIDDIADGLVHCLTLGVTDIAVRKDRLVRRRAVIGNRYDQRGVEPASVLVGTFKVKITRIRVSSVDQFAPGRTGIKPDVHDVGFFGEIAVWRSRIGIACR